jgi:environmental stress-induced protein Ves
VTTLRVIPASDYLRTRWKNDGGWTTEIARSGEADHFDWRVSIADIERDGPFSSFPGLERDLILLDGSGIELDIDAAAPVRVSRRFERAHFRGESVVGCRLIAGATRDFNVMTRRDAVRAEVVARPLVGSMLIFAEPGATWCIHVLVGHANVRSGTQRAHVAAGDSVLIDVDDGALDRSVVEGSGELVLVKLLRSAV